MLAKVFSSSLQGIDACPVEVEVDLARGLPDPAVKESKERVTSAIKNSQFDFPTRRITVNLAPADVKKEGSSLDLSIAIGILKASGAIKADDLSTYSILGELALDGKVRPINGALPIALELKERDIKALIIPEENAREASVVKELEVFPVKSLLQTVKFLEGELSIPPYRYDLKEALKEASSYEVDFSQRLRVNFM